MNQIIYRKMKKYIVPIIVMFIFNYSYSQDKKEVLLNINNEPVYVSEFKSVYNKNLNLVKDDSQKSVDGYMNLFIDYKLKVKEAYAQHLDKNESYATEFNKYRDQLSRNYIFEEKVTEELVKEAYERGLEEIDANHILILLDYDATPQDTLKAYNKIEAIYARAKLGEDFETLARENSEEPNAAATAGKLGYFTAFSMVYPFETMAYNTKSGEVSEIVRTQFGYHIIKVNNRRKKEPKISVAHIMITQKAADSTFNPEERINELSALLKQGESFENLAKQYSDDKNSAKVGGKMPEFGRGDLRAPTFEDAAYELKNPGDISQPIQTRFGWHIIQLIEKHPIPTFEEEKETLEQKTKGGIRSKMVTSALNTKIKEKYGFKVVNNFHPFFDNYVTDALLEKKWKYDTIPEDQDKILFTIGTKDVHFNDFAKFINIRQRLGSPSKVKSNLLIDFYDEFETLELKNYYKESLETENEDYAAIINEYRNGLLIFDVMNINIWEKAKNDSIGLQSYYEGAKDNYIWNDRVDAVIISSMSSSIAEEARVLLNQGKTPEEIKELLNTDDKVNVLISQGVYEKNQRELPVNFEVKVGISRVYSNKDAFDVINVKEVIPSGVKELNDVKGKVTSDYQNYLEAKWMMELRQKYQVEINKKSLKKLKKEIDS